MRTRADLLRFAVAFALRGASKLVRGLKQGLSEDERFRVADEVVNQLEKGGWRLSEELPDVTGKGFSTPVRSELMSEIATVLSLWNQLPEAQRSDFVISFEIIKDAMGIEWLRRAAPDWNKGAACVGTSFVYGSA
jgi:hypothetical protein